MRRGRSGIHLRPKRAHLRRRRSGTEAESSSKFIRRLRCAAAMRFCSRHRGIKLPHTLVLPHSRSWAAADPLRQHLCGSDQAQEARIGGT